MRQFEFEIWLRYATKLSLSYEKAFFIDVICYETSSKKAIVKGGFQLTNLIL